MKKFLAFLLIAIIACKTVKEMEGEEPMKSMIDALIKSLDAAILGPIIDAKKFGEKAAEQVCCSMLPDICYLCPIYVKRLEKFIN